MKAVHVFLQTDSAQDLLFVQMLGQRELNQDAVHGRVGVELLDQPLDFLLRGGGL